MLKVERKKSPPWKKWIPWMLLLLLAAGAAFLHFVAGREAEIQAVPRREDSRGTLSDRETAEIQRLRIQIRGQEAWSAQRDSAGQLRVLPEEGDASAAGWSVDAALGERIEDALAHVVYEDILSEDADEYQGRLAEFGLADPAVIASVTYTDGSSLTLRIGEKSSLSDADYRYMTVDGDPRLYAVAGSLAEDLLVEKELLHPVPQLQLQSARMDRIRIYRGSMELQAEWKLQGAIEDPEAPASWLAGWRDGADFVYYPADQDQISDLKKNAENLRLGMYVSGASAQQLAETGLDTPSWRVEIHLAAGKTGRITEEGAYDVQDWPEETFVLDIGKARNEMTEYCLWEGAVYTVSRFLLDPLTALDPQATAARYLAALPAENLSSLEITDRDGTRTVYELTRQSLPAAEGEDAPQTETVCRKNGQDISWSAFEAAYERWRVVDVTGRLPQGWVKKDTRVTVRFKSVSGGIHTLELSDFDALHDAVTLDGHTLFYLIKNGLPSLP